MRFDVITLFPELVKQVGEYGVVRRAREAELFTLECWNPRDFTTDVHRTVDDRPYGGGPGMVMRYEPLRDALKAVKSKTPQTRVIYLSPQGARLDQAKVNQLAAADHITLIAGRYEGIDERFIEAWVDEEISVGDYVLSGGELPVMTLVDAVVRQLPGALGHAESAVQDSFMENLLDCPQYSRPEVVDDRSVPSVLMSGDHRKILEWRKAQSLTRTAERRPDLLEKDDVTDK